MTQGPEQRAEQPITPEQDSLISSPTERGRERFKWSIALIGTAIGFFVGVGAASLIQYVYSPGSRLPNELIVNIAGVAGAAVGFVKRRELLGLMLTTFRR